VLIAKGFVLLAAPYSEKDCADNCRGRRDRADDYAYNFSHDIPLLSDFLVLFFLMVLF
jgi:hypothetical protein